MSSSLTSRPKSITWRARRIHRWLGLFIGIQFLLWTVGGLYFSWTDIDEIHGDHLRAIPTTVAAADVPLVSPAAAIAALREGGRADSLVGVELASVLGRPTWRIHAVSRADGARRRETHLADATTGAPRAPLDSAEAVAAAREVFVPGSAVKTVERLTSTDGHHEYREQPLPAWAITFDHPASPTIYIAAEHGQVRAIRHGAWRMFDFLWMLHTMDFRGRDDINNWILRAFSILGLTTVTSGFVLFVLTSRVARRRRETIAALETATAG